MWLKAELQKILQLRLSGHQHGGRACRWSCLSSRSQSLWSLLTLSLVLAQVLGLAPVQKVQLAPTLLVAPLRVPLPAARRLTLSQCLSWTLVP